MNYFDGHVLPEAPIGWKYEDEGRYASYFHHSMNLVIYFNGPSIKPSGWACILNSFMGEYNHIPLPERREIPIPDTCVTFDEKVAWAVMYWSMK